MIDLFRVVLAAPLVERRRRTMSLHEVVALTRAVARMQPRRSHPGRVSLRRVIAAIDAWMPGGPNCVRRSLMEMSLDAGAAEEPFYAGLRRGGGARSGHAWLGSQPVTEAYDAVIAV